MRIKRITQASIYEIFTMHDLAQELKVISAWLDCHTQILDWVEADLCREGIKDTGRLGMSVESVLRCALLKQYWQWTYRELEYHLMDSDTAYGFARLGKYRGFSDSTLQQTIHQIRWETWERINRLFGCAMLGVNGKACTARVSTAPSPRRIFMRRATPLCWRMACACSTD